MFHSTKRSKMMSKISTERDQQKDFNENGSNQTFIDCITDDSARHETAEFSRKTDSLH
jgi:hypothetical protein